MKPLRTQPRLSRLILELRPVRAAVRTFQPRRQGSRRAKCPRIHRVQASIGAAADIRKSRSYGNTDSSRTDVEESSHDTDFFAGLCGEFKLSPEQFTVFEEFSRTMRQCALAFLCVAVSNITLTMLQARQQMLHEPIVLLAGITVGNFAFWADSLLVAVLLHYGASSFQRVAEVKCDNQLPSIFQGISRLSLVFQQFAIAALAVAVVHTLEAAARHPPITKVAASLFFAIAGVRSAALWWLMSKHSSLGGGGVPEMLTRLKRGDKDRSPRWERFTMRLLVGHLLAYSIPGNDHQKDASQGSGEEANQQDNSQNGSGQPSSRHEGDREYEFTGGETQLLRICMDAMHTAGLALIVQGVATGLLGMANYLAGSPASAVSMGYNGFSKSLTAALIFRASAAFDRAVSGAGCNVSSMLRAIGDQGLTQLFHQLTVFAWTVAMSQVLQIFMPIISTSPIANLLTSKFGSIFGQGLVGLQNLVAGMA
ncbi:hypothetical protein WJX75_006915 [Coccomyxa subellipsoidea]|uniref:Uncharacterized protein n=1 Tax=Coccomyxa subellipsoidea TaxID=248742 RepID=A0ABR2YUD1_9CHLO